ncbi:accessory Sec system translocase SecA2, partial [Bacillus sp. GMa5/2]
DVENIYEEGYFDLVRNINLALRAKFLFDSNLDYFIQNGEIVLIDRITGRMLPGTKLQSGLHQAIEAKEDVEISDDLSVMATITFQNLFKQFERFSGMTATGKLGESEFFDLYSKVVIQIPTDKPIQRKDYGDKVFLNAEEKNRAILEDVVAIHETKRPVLLITRTAEVAEQFSTELFQMNIPNNLLIAQNVAKEAQMIAEAGQLSAVTVATSMAGRGTDIKLANGVHELGGLAVIISEHMENSRVDKQLRGRSGRQGDPGTSQIYISLDDYLVQRWGEDKLSDNKRLQSMDTSRLSDSRVFQHRVQRIVTKAQRVSEEQGMTMREMSNEYEKSISVQRDLIYQERDKVLNMQRVEDFNLEQLAKDVFRHDVSKRQDNLTQEQLAEYIYSNISFKFEGDTSQLNLKQHDNVIDFLLTEFQNQLAENKVQLK